MARLASRLLFPSPLPLLRKSGRESVDLSLIGVGNGEILLPRDGEVNCLDRLVEVKVLLSVDLLSSLDNCR